METINNHYLTNYAPGERSGGSWVSHLVERPSQSLQVKHNIGDGTKKKIYEVIGISSLHIKMRVKYGSPSSKNKIYLVRSVIFHYVPSTLLGQMLPQKPNLINYFLYHLYTIVTSVSSPRKKYLCGSLEKAWKQIRFCFVVTAKGSHEVIILIEIACRSFYLAT